MTGGWTDDPELSEMLAATWREHSDRFARDAELLASCVAGGDVDALRGAAHRLAGTLAMFGLDAAGELASVAEGCLLDADAPLDEDVAATIRSYGDRIAAAITARG